MLATWPVHETGGFVLAWYDAHGRAPTWRIPDALFDATGKGVVGTWTLRNVYPARWAGPDLDASGTGIAIEQLQLVHEGFL